MYDIIGDIHGYYNELTALSEKLGYTSGCHPSGRQLIFVGDLCDRGPYSDLVISAVMHLVNDGDAMMVLGNHDDKLRRYLGGSKVTINNGLDRTIEQIELAFNYEEFSQEVHDFLRIQPWRISLDDGKLIVVHAAAPENLQGPTSHMTPRHKKRAKAAAFYGVTTGNKDANGFPERIDWAESYRGSAVVVHGHVAQKEPSMKNNVYNVDTACVYGNKLTALRYPEMEFVSVDALKAYKQSRLTPERLLEDK